MHLHHLSESALRSLLSTTEDEHAVAELLDIEVSRRLLLLRAVLDAGDDRHEADFGGVHEAWRLLEDAEKLEPAGFRTALLDPQVGLWAARLFRRMSRVEGAGEGRAAVAEPPFHAELGFLSLLAAAVSVTAAADFRIRVPVWEGAVHLPGLGRALVGGEAWGWAEIDAHDGVVTVTSDSADSADSAASTTVTLPADLESDAPGWQGLRRLRSAHAGMALTVAVEDLGPYAAVPGLPTGGRLTPDRFASWQRWFDAMWPVLVTDHPAAARALSTGLLAIVPLPRGERLRVRAASSSDAFGCVLLSEPDEDVEVLPAQLGVALVHEFRHTLLNGLIFLTPLFEECGELFHAPWRDDPRPLGGLVHGAYAFSGVAHYWRTRGAEGLAGFEFALWRSAVHAVLDTLRNHPALTPLGCALVGALDEQTAPWRGEPVGAREQHLALLATAHHRATWRAHHRHTPSAHAEALARAWESEGTDDWGGTAESRGVERPGGARRPDSALGHTGPGVPPEPEFRTDPGACRLDALALLARLSIIAPTEFDELRTEEDPARLVPGVGPADLALVGGDAGTAVKLYAHELAGPRARPAAWAGLGLALIECGDSAAGAFLTAHPELAVAVSRLLPEPPDPVALVRWLARWGGVPEEAEQPEQAARSTS